MLKNNIQILQVCVRRVFSALQMDFMVTHNLIRSALRSSAPLRPQCVHRRRWSDVRHSTALALQPAFLVHSSSAVDRRVGIKHV